MRKVILLEHITLDGFVAGPQGEMDWIHIDDEMFDVVGDLTKTADTALYGRATYQMMESYWPTACEQPEATRHDIEHSNWVNKATKIVFSRTLKETSWNNTRIISENINAEIRGLKNKPGENMLMIGSPGIAQTFMQLKLIDEYWLYLNPVVLGNGMRLFNDVHEKMNLKLVESKNFNAGVMGLHYSVQI